MGVSWSWRSSAADWGREWAFWRSRPIIVDDGRRRTPSARSLCPLERQTVWGVRGAAGGGGGGGSMRTYGFFFSFIRQFEGSSAARAAEEEGAFFSRPSRSRARTPAGGLKAGQTPPPSNPLRFSFSVFLLFAVCITW